MLNGSIKQVKAKRIDLTYTAPLAQPTLKAALLVAAGHSPWQAATPAVAELVRTGLKTMSAVQIRIAVALLLSLSVCAAGSGILTPVLEDEPKGNLQPPSRRAAICGPCGSVSSKKKCPPKAVRAVLDKINKTLKGTERD